jgi:hypothetical protein
LVLAFAACSSPPPPEAAPGCNPLIGDDCMTPFPSSFHESSDATTRTGVRVSIAASVLPVQADKIPILPDRINAKDGFSPATPFLVYFKRGVDPANLPTADDLAASVTAQSAVQVLDFASGARVPVMAELDANAIPGDRQPLIIRPLLRLQPGTRYIVALVGLKDAAKQPLVPAPFRALRDGTALSKSLAPLKSRFDEIFAKLTAAGVARSSLTLAWDVVTASDETATSHLVNMRKIAFDMIGTLGYTLMAPVDTPDDPHLLREIQGTVQVPSFLADDSGTSGLSFGADGQPAMRAVVDVPFVIHVPQCAVKTPEKRPLPVVVFGHGLFGSGLDVRAPGLEAESDAYCGIYIATDWIGLSSGDILNVSNIVGSDLNGTQVITDRLQQAHLNAQVMTRIFLTKIVNDDALKWSGAALTDGKEAYYFGISNGGIQGATFMALSDDITRGVLNVPGCDWSLLMFRSADFNRFKLILGSALRDPVDAQLTIALSQSEWDYTDPATFAPHLLHDPLIGLPVKQILVQESIGDGEVSNLATRMLARTMGLSGFDLEQPVYGVATVTPPLDSAYTQWDSHPAVPPPTGDQALKEDNGAHNAVWQSPLAQTQIHQFLRPGGQATRVCNGVCNIGQ